MISRRSLLTTGVVVGVGAAGIAGAAAVGRLDDLAELAGVKPRPRPDEGDVERLRGTANDLADLAARVRATSEAHPQVSDALVPIAAICREHLASVSGAEAEPPSVPRQQQRAVARLADQFSASATERSTAAVEAISPEVAMVLASMAASQRQCAQVVRGLT